MNYKKDKNIDSTKAILELVRSKRWEMGEESYDRYLKSVFEEARNIREKSVVVDGKSKAYNFDRKLDQIVTSRWLGFPIMFFMLAIVFWLTIAGANVPSQLLATLLLDTIHPVLKDFAIWAHFPWWLDGLLFDGVYLTVAWVVSVMLPPMAIFFPLFTLLEDFGYLPRVAFNMDNLFRKAGAHGKQALTMAMGFGCNAAGVVATRVIDSPRERLIAIITNNFSLCNGRWPTQILIATIFIGAAVPPHLGGLISAGSVIFIALLGIFFSLVVSWGLSRTVLKGEASSFSLELPPYRPPRIWQTIYTSIIDRTLIVLWRAVIFAVPAGVVIWLIANINIENISLAEYFINWTNPVALLFGLNGVIFLAYIIAIPANEIVIPTVLMLTVLGTGLDTMGAGAGVMFELDSLDDTATILEAGGWTLLTAINLMLFSLLHNPCSTTLYTIWKETKSMKWTMVSAVLPILMGLIITFFVTQIWFLATA
jgi:ferrous iron transport protein B